MNGSCHAFAALLVYAYLPHLSLLTMTSQLAYTLLSLVPVLRSVIRSVLYGGGTECCAEAVLVSFWLCSSVPLLPNMGCCQSPALLVSQCTCLFGTLILGMPEKSLQALLAQLLKELDRLSLNVSTHFWL